MPKAITLPAAAPRAIGARAAACLLLLGALPASGAPLPHRVEPFTGMRLVRIEPARFTMGSPAGEPMREAQEVAHEVSLTRPFELGVFEVTQEEWQRVMGTSPSRHRDCPRCPVEEVNYLEVQEFLRRLEKVSPWSGFRLPTEAEWELAPSDAR